MKRFSIALLALAAAFAAAPMQASTIDSETFTIGSVTGPLAGNTYTGSFSWDASNNIITAFNTDFPSWTDDVNTYGATLSSFVFIYPTLPGLSAFIALAPVGNPDAFAFFGGAPSYFTYGDTLVVNNSFADSGDGEVTFGPITGGPVPEPGTFVFLATGLAAALGAARRRLKA